MEVVGSEEKLGRNLDEHIKPATVEDSSEETKKPSWDEVIWPDRGKDLSEETVKLSLTEDIKTGSPSTPVMRKDVKHGEEEATRFTKFLRQIAESFEDGNISVIKPYLHEMIKHSKDKNRGAFEESVLNFTEATSFKGGISVSLIKQVHRGFHMILDEPEFGDLVVAKVEAIEKEDQPIAGGATGVVKSSWPTDVKSTVIIAEDIQVGGTKTFKSQSGPFELDVKRSPETGPSKKKELDYTESPSGKFKSFGSERSETKLTLEEQEVYRAKIEGFKQTSPPIEQEVGKTRPSESSKSAPKTQ